MNASRLKAAGVRAAVVLSLLAPAAARPAQAAAIPLASGYSQTFDGLAGSGTGNPWSDDATLTGWYATRATYNAGSGTSNAGALYSFGAAGGADRALGSLASGSTSAIYYGLRLVNDTPAAITELVVSYTGEQWRNDNSTLLNQRLDFSYQAGASSLTGGAWTDVDALDFIAPVAAAAPAAALDGNDPANRALVSASISGLNLAPGQEIWLRWQDSNDPGPGGDQALAIDDVTVSAASAPGDAAPAVATVVPANGATDVAVDSNLSVTFSELVAAAEGAFRLSCSASGAIALAVSGGPAAFALDPGSDFAAGESCTLTVAAASVADLDADDPPDAMSADFTSSFTAAAGPAITRIHAIQGSGAVVAPGTFTVEAIVVGDYQAQGSGQLRGFFVQEEDADVDVDPATSEGLFVFCSACPTAVSVGDRVRVTGATSDFFGMSQLSATTADSVAVLSSGHPLPAAAPIDLPVPGVPAGDLAAATAAINAYFEAFEGMLVTFPDTLAISEYFELARYGQLILTEGGRPRQFTDANPPSAAGLIDHEIGLASRTIILDDADNRQNRPVDAPNTPHFHPVPGLSTANFFRGGDTITGLTGVLHWSFAGQTGTDAWRIRPVTEAYAYAFTPANPRPAPPAVGGRLKAASFNVLNYFLTIDTTSSNDTGACSPSGLADCRGADSAQELDRQRAKLLAALQGLDADVLGLIEMENTPGVEPLADIVAGLPGYAFIDTGAIGTDAIRVGLIYKAASVRPVGGYAILDSSVDPRFVDTRNRPALAQTFEETATGARFTVAVNHLKSKGSGCGAGDDDLATGQGNCNGTRTQAALALADWLASDPTGSGDPDVLIIGDLNSYAQEDPITALRAAGYTDLVAAFGGPSAYSYVFDGQLGYLDHALANPALAPQVSGVAEWHINADEVPLFDYNDDVRDAGEASFEEESDALPLRETGPYRTSDHDPVVIGLNLNAPPAVDAGGPYRVDEGGSVTLTAAGSDPDNDALAYAWDLDGDGVFEAAGPSATFSAAGLDGPAARVVTARATDAAGNAAVDTAEVAIDNAAPTVGDISAPAGSQLVNATVTLNASYADAGASDTHTATWEWGDGAVTQEAVSGGAAAASHAYVAPGVYAARLTIADDDGGSAAAESAAIVVYDPAAKVVLKIQYGFCDRVFQFGSLKQALPWNPCPRASADLVAVTAAPHIGFFDIRLGAASFREDLRNLARINAARGESVTFRAGADLGGRKFLGALLKVEGAPGTIVRAAAYDGAELAGEFVFALSALAPQGGGALANNYALSFFAGRAFDRLVFTADAGAYSIVGGADGSGPSEFYVTR